VRWEDDDPSAYHAEKIFCHVAVRSEQKEKQMLRKVFYAMVALGLSASSLFAVQPSDVLQSAAKKGVPALLLVTDPASPQYLGSARTTISEATKLIKGCTTVELDRTDKANADLVTKYGLAGAPMPLILVFAANGSIAGGIRSVEATPPALAGMVPSQMKAQVLQALQADNAVLLVASKKGMKEQAKIMANCALACGQIKSKATTLQIDLDDTAEKRFLGELGVSTATDAPVTLVINQKGQIAGTFNGPVDVATLAQAATKKTGGCCPTGSGKSCGTAKK
jgi:hypothetical protein